MWLAVIVAALGYFVDIFDILLFSIVRVASLSELGLSPKEVFTQGIYILNLQLAGLLIGGVVWGIWADKIGRLSVLYGSILLYSIANLACAFVYDVNHYAIYRFVAGFGLAGELGAGITLVSELLPKEKRGWGATIVTGFGLLGAVTAGLISEVVSWRSCYLIGGVLGILLLFARIKVGEGEAFKAIKHRKDIIKGSLKLLFGSYSRVKRYIYCVMLGAPIMTAVYIFATFSPEIGKSMGFENVTSARSIMFCYLGICVGDFFYGALSQLLQSRKKANFLSLILTLVLVVISFIFLPTSETSYYFYNSLFGFATANWAVIMTLSAESFGTNLRATATTSIPNFIRGSAFFIVLAFSSFKTHIFPWHGAILTMSICIAIAVIANIKLKETFSVDLDYLEE